MNTKPGEIPLATIGYGAFGMFAFHDMWLALLMAWSGSILHLGATLALESQTKPLRPPK